MKSVSRKIQLLTMKNGKQHQILWKIYYKGSFAVKNSVIVEQIFTEQFIIKSNSLFFCPGHSDTCVHDDLFADCWRQISTPKRSEKASNTSICLCSWNLVLRCLHCVAISYLYVVLRLWGKYSFYITKNKILLSNVSLCQAIKITISIKKTSNWSSKNPQNYSRG